MLIGPRAFDSTSKEFLISFGFGDELNLNGKTKAEFQNVNFLLFSPIFANKYYFTSICAK
jgi:hypothetical protein